MLDSPEPSVEEVSHKTLQCPLSPNLQKICSPDSRLAAPLNYYVVTNSVTNKNALVTLILPPRHSTSIL